ncbi:MAG: hypothetical protein QMD07_00960 [Thermodesulfovibrionales bacterium]|nr:hypothetical protein [Thermodesulfovibrionales bacterium]
MGFFIPARHLQMELRNSLKLNAANAIPSNIPSLKDMTDRAGLPE